MIKRSLIIGYGQIGKAIAELSSNAGYKVAIEDPLIQVPLEYFDFDLIHICFPFDKEFRENVEKYLQKYYAPIVLIHSTIQPFSLDNLKIENECEIYHCPIRGTHPNMIEGIHAHPMFYGKVNFPKFSKRYFTGKLLEEIFHTEVMQLLNYNETALGKLLNTNWYAMQIAMANQIQRICDDFDLRFEAVYTMWMKSDSINSKYQYDENEKRAKGIGTPIPRSIMVPGEMGGNCIMPNIKLSEELFSENFTKWIKEMNQYGVDLRK